MYKRQVPKADLNNENLEALEKGLPNLLKHVSNIKNVYKLPCVVAINAFPTDTKAELDLAERKCKELGVNVAPVSYTHLDVYKRQTVDFALTYFVVSGELERSGVPCNLIISDAGGLSVLTAWAAGKLSSASVAKYIQENVEGKVKSRKLVIPGKVAVLKGDIEAKLPGWEIIVGPMEAVQLVKFLKDLTA